MEKLAALKPFAKR